MDPVGWGLKKFIFYGAYIFINRSNIFDALMEPMKCCKRPLERDKFGHCLETSCGTCFGLCLRIVSGKISSRPVLSGWEFLKIAVVWEWNPPKDCPAFRCRKFYSNLPSLFL